MDPSDAAAALDARVPLEAAVILLRGEHDAIGDLAARLSAAGARVWTLLPAAATDAARRVPPGTAGVFLLADSGSDVDPARAIFDIRQAATRLRAERPSLGVGLQVTPALAAPVHAGAVAPYVDTVLVPRPLAATAAQLHQRFRGLPLWLERGDAGVLAGGAGLSEHVGLVEAASRAVELLAARAGLLRLMPPGLGALPEVTVICDRECRTGVWLHPETLEAIAVVTGAAPGAVITIAPDALDVSLADTASGGPPRALPGVRTPGGVQIRLPDLLMLPAVLVIRGWRGSDEEVYRAAVEVSAARALTVEEVIARHQAQRARQALIVDSVISTGSTRLTFEVPGFAAPLEVTADTVIYTRGALTEVAQRDIRVNGVDMGVEAGVPRLPIIEPERVATPPLVISLTAAYSYRLAGRERRAGRDCYVVAFAPAAGAGPAVSGRAWIDASTFAMVRVEAVQTGLRGPIISAEQHDVFTPQRVGDREVWLPIRSSSFQVYQAAGLRTPIHRELVTLRHEVNPADFDARLQQAHASRAVMLRDTPEGYRYLVPPESGVPRGEAPARVLSEAAGQRVVALAFGVLIDPNITVPLPFAGLSYLDFNFLRKGAQFSAFFGGAFGQAAWTVPGVIRPGWQLTGRAFGIAARYNDRSVREGREQYDENILQRPLRADVALIAPLSPRVQLRLGYELAHTAFGRSDDTAADFLVPADAIVHGARLALEMQRGPWTAGLWWNPARRQGWRAWGRAGLDYRPGTEDFQRYGLTLARAWVLHPGTVARVEGGWMDGHDLDRFSRHTFDSFEHRLRGYPSASIRYDRGVVLRSVGTWAPTRRLRLDGFFDYAAVRDPGLADGLTSLPGVGAAAEVPLPRRLMLAVEYGYGIRARNTDGSQGTHVIRISGFKIF